ncbi:branched-chain amino acid ABC transporter substrate-binding protein [Pseudofrankia sp. BMG5.36]|uniref:branched-chain amino acid ABC transporter substrate-binding protein n=1 Tax=Pseudofrankia sp. BMG5.36 TaxID=1834512 RepID=UPI000B158B2E|nr:branched-chain amino acid ABC transporter substrate-binding protein [Pseudofrankia sp. BMG5.36]
MTREDRPGDADDGDRDGDGRDAARAGGAGSPLRRLVRWLAGSARGSEIVATDPVVGGGVDPDGPLVPGWQVAKVWLVVAARWIRHSARTTAAWAGRRRRTRRGRALLAGLLALLVALPTGLTLGLLTLRDGRAGGGPGGSRGPQVMRIGVMAPLSGDLGNIGGSVRDAVALAVDESNKSEAIPGWKAELVAKDDLSRPDGGAAAAEAFAEDSALVGVVGPLSSNVARIAVPVLDAGGIPVVSPSNGEPELTAQDEPPYIRKRPYDRYFRLSGSDAVQAKAGADYAVHVRHRTKIIVVDGGPFYGDTLAGRFASYAIAAGAEVLTTYQVKGDGADGKEVQEVAEGIQEFNPDLVYTSTGYLFASALRQRMADEAISVQILGTDAMLSARYLDSAGEAAEGDLATDLAVPLSRLPAAGAFADEYLKRWGPVVGGPEQPAVPDKKTGSPTPTPSAGAAGSAAPPGAGSARPGGSDGQDRDGQGMNTPGGSGSSAPGARVSGEDGSGRGDEPLAVTGQEADMIPALAAYAYDSARALLRAAAVVLPGRVAVDDATRAAIAAQIARGSFAGVTGQVAFDAFGDRRDPAAVIYAIVNGRFVPTVIPAR